MKAAKKEAENTIDMKKGKPDENTASANKKTPEISKEKKESHEALESKPQKEKKREKTLLYVSAFAIPLVVALIALMLGGFAPFGDKDVLTTGGFEKYRYFLNDLHDQVHEGNINTTGLVSSQGYNVSTSWAYYLSDPTNLITLLFDKSDMAGVLNILYAIKLGLAGLFFSFFLSYRRRISKEKKLVMEGERADIINAYREKIAAKKKAKLVAKSGAKNAKNQQFDVKLGGTDEPTGGALLFLKKFDITTLALSVTYALSAYMLGSGLNVTWLGAVAVFPLVMLGIDKLINEKKWLFYTLTLAVSFYMNFYITIIVFIFTLIYFFLQDFRDTRHIVTAALYKLLGDILAIGAASLIIITSLRSSLMSSMLNLEFPYAERTVNIFDVIKYQLAGFKPDAATGGTDGVMIYAGVFVLLLALMYAMNGNISITTRVKTLILTATLYVATFFTTLNYLFNGFYYTRTNSTVFAFILIFILLIMAESVLSNIEHQRSSTVTLSFILVIGLIFASLSLSTNYSTMSPFMTSLELAALYFFIIILFRNDSMTHILFKTVFGITIIAELAVSFISGLSSSGEKALTYAQTDTAKYEAAEDHIHKIDPNAKVDVFIDGESSSNPVTNMLAGIDYVIALEGSDHVVSFLDKTETYGGIDIYKNSYVAENGFYVSEDIKDIVFDEDQVFKSLNILTKSLADVEVFNQLSGEFLSEHVVNVQNNEYIETRKLRLSFTTPETGELYATILGDVIDLGEYEADQLSMYVYDPHNKPSIYLVAQCSYANIDKNSFISLCDSLKINNASAKVGSDELNISFEAAKDGYIALPVDPNVDYNVDGAMYFRILDTVYLLVPVEQGMNTMTISEDSSVFTVSLIITILAIISIIALHLVTRSASGKKYEEEFSAAKVNRLTSFVSANRVYILCITILSLVFCMLLFIRAAVPFGKGLILTHDGMYQSYPIITGVIKSFTSGNFRLINYHIGAGIDNYVANAPLLVLPHYFLVALFPLSKMQLCFTIIDYIQFILPACAFILYLTHRPSGKRLDKRNLLLIPLALAYNLSAFVVSYISHVGFVQYAIIFPLFILAFERLMYNKKYLMYVIILAYTMIWGVYYAFMLAEFTVLYFLCLEFKSVKDFFTKALRAAVYSIISAGLAAVMLLPYYLSTLSSPYAYRDSALPTIKFSSDFLKVFDFMKTGSKAVIITSEDWNVNLYCGLLMFLCIPLYALNKNIKLSVRIRKLVLSAFLFLAFSNPLFNYVLHGFHIQAKVPNRFSLFLIFMIITMAYDIITNIKEYKFTKASFISASAWGILLSAIFVINENGKLSLPTKISIAFIVAYLLVFTAVKLKKVKKYVMGILSLLLISELLFSTFNYAQYDILGYHATTEDDSYNTAETLVTNNGLDKDHVRSEYLSSRHNTAMFLGNESISIFHSNMTSNNLDFISYHGIGLYPITNNVDYNLTNPIADLFLNVKYHIINEYFENNFTYSYMNPVDSISNLTLYENPYAVSFGFFIDKDNIYNSLNDRSFYDKYPFTNMMDLQNNVAKEMTGKALYDNIELETDMNSITDKSSYIMSDTSEFDDPSNTDPVAHVRVVLGEDITGDIYICFGFFAYLTNKETTGVKEVYFDIDADRYYEYSGSTYYLSKLNEDTLKEMHDILSVAPLTDIKDTFNTISGNVNAPSDGTVYISLPNQDGWTATVDGEEVEIADFLEGIGVPVTAGQHKITIKYMTPGLKAGAIISLITLLLFIGYVVFDKKVLSKRKRSDEDDVNEDDNDNESDNIEVNNDDSIVLADSDLESAEKAEA